MRPGVEVLLENPSEYLVSPEVGLVTNPSGVTSRLMSTLDAFLDHPGIEPVAVFGPEHGATGDKQDALPIGSSIDPNTRLPFYSLYGEVQKPTEAMLEGIENLVFDVQDVGARFYTYASTLTYSLETASEHGIPIVVLDRPNPVNGVTVEGNILEPGFASFVGLHPIPIRHGMTIGELALLINGGTGAELEVVKMEGWIRDMWFDETGLPWVQPSPNIPTPETAAVYPGTCLFEGVNVSEGRGTTRPFEYVGAPWTDGRRWASYLNELGLAGVRFRACSFTPTFSKYRDERCGGIQIHVTDRDSFRPVETSLHMLSTAMELWPDDFEWLPPRYDERRHFDLLAGTDKIRMDLSRGVAIREIVEGWTEGLRDFERLRKACLLYPDGGR
ncbi:MAG: DUF1343 domain-containing protein [Candidatus Bathyarchaeota archaeon]|nr:DUF1343 domain-containing protein [Candidatus Bathyarchaeota archaeon]